MALAAGGAAMALHEPEGELRVGAVCGAIAPAAGGDDLFVHQSAISAPGFRSLMEGEEVEFKVLEDRGKMKAIDVTGPKGEFVQGAPRNNRNY